jgi:DNA polymerase III alpha subunit
MKADATPSFTHLHVRSHYTLLGGTASADELAARAAAEGMPRLALTDTNALYGAVAFARACRTAGVQPILGMTVTVAPPQDRPAGQTIPPGRLVLLSTGPEGYRSLCRLSSLIQGSPERTSLAARGLSWEALEARREGLICLSGGRAGWVERCLRAGGSEAAYEYVARLASVYGENACLSLELHQPQDRAIAQQVVEMGQRLGLPTAAVQPVTCLSPQDAPRAIQFSNANLVNVRSYGIFDHKRALSDAGRFH